MRCASCGVENPDGMKFCEECRTKLVRASPSCGCEVRPTAKFCGEYSIALWTAGSYEEALVKAVGEWKLKSRTVTF
jgi:predicted amidophosphoribosyltransferase